MLIFAALYGAGFAGTLNGILLAKMNTGEKIRWAFVVAAILVSLIWFISVPHSVYKAWRFRHEQYR